MQAQTEDQAKKKKQQSNPYGKVAKTATNKNILKKDHHDSNMVVSVRVRPLSKKEQDIKDFNIIQIQDKLIIVMDRVEIECSEKN